MRRSIIFSAFLTLACGLGAAPWALGQGTTSLPPVNSPTGQQAQPAATEAQTARSTAAVADKLQAVHDQLMKLTTELGVPNDAQRAKVARELDQLASHSGELAEQLPSPAAKAEARNYQLNGYNSLARQAQQEGNKAEVNNRVNQLRETANRTRSIAGSGSGALSDFWLLQADLFDLNESVANPDQRMVRAIGLLEGFLGKEPAAPTDPERATIDQVKLSLLRLYDQRGQSDKLVALARQLDSAGQDEPGVRAFLDEDLAYRNIIGSQFQANLRTTNGQTWSSSQQLGQPVLIHFYLTSFVPSVEAVRELQNILRAHPEWNLSVLSVRLDAPIPSGLLVADAAGERVVDAKPGTPVVGKTGPLSAVSKTSAAPAATQPSAAAAAQVALSPSGSSAPGGGGSARGPATAGPVPPPAVSNWPVYHEGAGQVSLRRMFRVNSLPRFVLIDPRGRVAAVGGSLAIVDQIPAMLAVPASAATQPAR